MSYLKRFFLSLFRGTPIVEDTPERKVFLQYYDAVAPIINDEVQEECGKTISAIYAKYGLEISGNGRCFNIKPIPGFFVDEKGFTPAPANPDAVIKEIK